TDITMPVMDGIELAKQVRSRFPKVRIVFLTVYSEFVYTRQAIQLGIRDYLLKAGLTTAQLLESCRKLADEVKAEHERNEQQDEQNRLSPHSSTTMEAYSNRKLLMDQFRPSGMEQWNRFIKEQGWKEGYYSAIWL